MKKSKNSKEIAGIFKDRLQENNIISEVFGYLGFNCAMRCFIDPQLLDERIKDFYEARSIETLTAVIELMLQAKNKACVDDKAIVQQVKNYIMEHLRENIAFEQVAYELHISYYYLSHLFKKTTGKSLNQFRAEKRMEMAVRMLVEGNEKISEIAAFCGFDSASYFSETFAKYVGETPSEIRSKHAGCILHRFYDLNDMLLSFKMPSIRFLDKLKVQKNGNFEFVRVHNPDDGFGTFLHEAAIIAYKGVLYASWYNCEKHELVGYTPIVGRRSYDGGKTWSSPEIIAEDKSGNILYCPPVYGICEGKLYMLINQMVSADHMHALDLYVLNEDTDRFELVWSRPIPFKLNTNVVTLPNGKLMLTGRIAELDGFPNTPAVMISDSGKIDAQWRVVKVAENGILPDGESLEHPETTVICCNDVLYLFNRNDFRRVPLVYISRDFGESWSEVMAHDIPYRSVKIYSGNLSDGRCYLIANKDRSDRSKLVLYTSEQNELKFTKETVLLDCAESEDCIVKIHYPAAVESDGKLYIIATADYAGENLKGTGTVLFTVDLAETL